MTIVYKDDINDISKDLQDMKEYFASRDIIIGISESLSNDVHIIKVLCDDMYYTERTLNLFYRNLANILYKIVIQEFYKNEIDYFLNETYFFLRDEELKDIRKLCLKNMDGSGEINDNNMVYCINKQNKIIEKIMLCIEQNKEININGFVTFRMKELVSELEGIVDKVVENYMAEKEYNEFIKLLKYFVDIQESKIEKINIIIDLNGSYIIQDGNGNNIIDTLLLDLNDARYSGSVSMEDIIISGLITNAPKKINIHCVENCNNEEFIETIKNVFGDRVLFCDNCKICNVIKGSFKI